MLGWWKHKDDPNVLFLKYEDLKKVITFANNSFPFVILFLPFSTKILACMVIPDSQNSTIILFLFQIVLYIKVVVVYFQN